MPQAYDQGSVHALAGFTIANAAKNTSTGGSIVTKKPMPMANSGPHIDAGLLEDVEVIERNHSN